MKPINTKIVVKPEEAQATTSTGIIIPDTAQEKSRIGEVIAVGEGTNDYKMKTKVGDRVLFGKMVRATEFQHEGEELLIMDEQDILVVL